MIHFRRIPLVCALAALPSWSWSTDQGYSKTGAPNWPSTDGPSPSAVCEPLLWIPFRIHRTGNPALLPLLEAHTVTATSGFLDVDRKYLYTGYALPLC